MAESPDFATDAVFAAGAALPDPAIASTAPPPVLQPPKILVVDDLRPNRVAVRKLLAHVDAEVIEADGGNQALARTLDHEFALVLADVAMPDMDGYELAQLLRGEERTRALPIIFVTASYKDDAHRLRGYGVGAVDYIEKPIEPEVLLSKVRVFLELYQKQRQVQQALDRLAEQNRRLDAEIQAHRRTEQALRESEARFRLALISAPIPIMLRAEDGEVLLISHTWTEVSGYRQDELRTVDDWVKRAHIGRQDEALETIRHSFDFAEPHGWGAYPITTASGDVRQWDFSTVPLDPLPDGRRLILVMAVDVTNYRKAWKALRDRISFQNTLLDTIPIPIYFKDAAGRYLSFNPAMEKITGLSSQNVVGKTEIEVEDEAAAGAGEPVLELARLGAQQDSRLLREGGTVVRETPARLADGEVRETLVYKTVWHNADGSVGGIVGAMLDLTERKRSEESLRTLGRAVEQSPASVVITDPKGTIEYVNPRFLEMTGYTREEVIGRNPRLLKSGYTPADEYARLWRTVLSGTVWRGEFHNRRKDGSLIWVSASISAVYGENGAISHLIAVEDDITERRRIAEALRASEERFRLAMSGTNDGVWDYDIAARLVYFSPRWKEIVGYREDEIGETLDEWLRRVHPEDMETLLADLDAHVQGETPAFRNTHRLRHRDGFYRWILSRGRLVTGPDGQPRRMVGANTDMTEVRRDQERLQALKERLELLFRCAGEGIYGVDGAGRITFANPAVERMTGFPVGELVGRPALALFHHSRADGESLPEAEFPVLDTCTTGRAQSVSDAILWRRDGSSFPAEYTVTALETMGRVSGAVVVFHDITDRRKYEAGLEEARAAAEQANQAKSTFLAVMSHELRTPLNSILGFSELIRDQAFGPIGVAKYVEYAEDIRSSGEHLLDLISEILDLSKIESGRMEIVAERLQPAHVIGSAIRLLSGRAEARQLSLCSAVAKGCPLLWADERAVKQILFNLITNAIKFTPAGGAITITAAPAATGGGVDLAVTDTGCGIPPEKIELVFQPFWQADNRYNRRAGGTGLGLSLVRGLAQLHGGSIRLTSALGQGTTVAVHFPPRPDSPETR